MFEDGDVIVNKGMKSMVGVVQEAAIIQDLEVGNWFVENTGARWILLTDWQRAFTKVKPKEADELRERILDNREQMLSHGGIRK